jgi:UDP-N-acetylmuramyl pentapeptide phosphotransferase/UDP-N-acetylglucosamine-1-phosphate transferase
LVTPLALVGFLDDRHNLSASKRYGMQLVTAMVITLTSPLCNWTFQYFPLFVLLLIAITALINFINFMDGLDGLVASCMLVSLTVAAIKLSAPWPLWVLVGALLGFLFWNWSPAKVFMGDVGSTFLGGVFGLVVLQASSWPDALAILLVASPLLSDACLCVLRRLLAGQRVSQPHCLHLYQRLHQAGWSHGRVSTLYVSATILLALSSLLGGLAWVSSLSAIQILVGIWLDLHVAVPFGVASRKSLQILD